MMHSTLLLCFIHGFKGTDETFGGFPQHLRALVANSLPQISVKAVVYPQFETRGDLKECVSKFRDWLENSVIDLEIANETPSPTINPSVAVVLVGHSMGGVLAADVLISIASELPIPYSDTSVPYPSSTTNTSTTSTGVPPVSRSNHDRTLCNSIFPHIQGVLAFDTPYLGISPGVVAHGAESQIQTASSAYSAFSAAVSVFGLGSTTTSSKEGKRPVGALHAGPAAAKEGLAAAAAESVAASSSQSWGRYAMFAGAAGAMAAGGAAAYLNRETLSSGWKWSTSHLEFVGCLFRGEELKTRVSALASAHSDRGVGFIDFYTVLGAAAARKEVTSAGGFVEIGGKSGHERTFCNLPSRSDWKKFFAGTINEKASDEVQAHMCMFSPRDNPGYYVLSERAKEKVIEWVNYERHVDSKDSDILEESAEQLDEDTMVGV